MICFFFIRFYLNIIAKFSIMQITHLYKNFALVDANIYWILIIVLFSRSNILLVVVSKLLCKESITTTIAILSQISQSGSIDTCSCLMKNCTFVKILITSLLQLLGLLIKG